MNGPDYRDVDPDAAMTDFHKRIEHYEETYERIDPVADEYVYDHKRHTYFRILINNR